MTPLGTLIVIFGTAVPACALSVLDRRWHAWLLPMIPLPFVGETLRHILDPIYMSAFTVPPALAVLAPLAMIILEQRKQPDTSDLVQSCIFLLLVIGTLFGILAVFGEVGFNRDGQYCWDEAQASSSDCWLNPFLIANSFIGYAALPIAILGPLPALWFLAKRGRPGRSESS